MFLNYNVFGLILLTVLSLSTASAQNQIAGKWLSENKEGITSIYENNGKYFGKITWLKKPNDSKGIPFTDTENPDKSKRNQPLIGLFILKVCISLPTATSTITSTTATSTITSTDRKSVV